MKAPLFSCGHCGARLPVPNLLPLLLGPPVLGALTWFGLPSLAARIGAGYALAVVSLPFVAYLIVLSLAGRRAASVMSNPCADCGR